SSNKEMAQASLPFKVGEIVEVRSFEEGYRGAWFRCKEETSRALTKRDYSHGERLLPQREITLTRKDCFSKRICYSSSGDMESCVKEVCPKAPPGSDPKALVLTPKRLGPFSGPRFRPKRLGGPRRGYVLEAFALILNIYTKEEKLFYSLKYLDYDGEEIHHTQVYQQFEDGEEWLMVRPSYPPCYQEREVRKIEADQAPLVVVHGSWQVGDLVDWDRDGCFWCATVLTVKRNEPFQIELFPPPLGEGETYKALRKDVRPTLDWSPEDGWTLPSTDGRKSQSVRLVKREKGVDHVPGKEKTERAKKQKTERHTQHRTERDAQQKTEGDMQPEKGNGEIRQNIDESDSIEAAVYDLEELIVRIEWIKNMLSPDVGEGSTWKYQDYRPSSK
ncbi:hypothetical protein HID58_009462, partial [Brassica napus]